jgi:protein arginine N-methyltransferase 2
MLKVYLEIGRLHHNDVGLNTEWFCESIRVFVSIAILANNDPATNSDKSAMWFYMQDREKRLEDPGTLHAVPICALAPTVPRTLVPNSGWNNLPQSGHIQ